MLYLLLLSIIAAVHEAINIGDINDIRFATGSSDSGGELDGVLEINFNGTWGTICNTGFNELSASVICYMLGFSPSGSVITSAHVSQLTPILTDVNCDGRIDLDADYDETTVHLGLCDYTPIESDVCNTQVAVMCTEETSVSIPTRTNADNCSVANATVRLMDGSGQAGRLEIQHDITGEWGTICADGFDEYAARAACRMLCTSDINMQYAYPVLYKYPPATASTPIHLANIVCPIGANSLYDCDFSGGFGATGECTHAMDVGLNCGPPENITDPVSYKPDLKCNQTTAVLSYSKAENPDLNASMIQPYGDVPSTCEFYVRETAESFDAIVPLDGCSGNVSLSNDSTIAIAMQVIRYYFTGNDGVISTLPSITEIICYIDRQASADPGSDSAFVISDPDRNSVSMKANITVNLGLFRNANFTDRVNGSIALRLGRPVFVLVSVVDPTKPTKLIVNNCWATAEPNRTAEVRKDLIIERCVAHPGLVVIPQTPQRVGFTFPAFYIGTPGALVPTNPSLYVHCNTILCDIRENSCLQFCPNLTVVRGARMEVADKAVQPARIYIQSGSLSVDQDDVFDDGEE